MGALLHELHAKARPAAEAQALEADAALFSTISQAIAKRTESPSDILKRLKAQAERMYEATDTLFPWSASINLSDDENKAVSHVYEALSQLQASFALLAEEAEEREDVRNEPRSAGHYF